MGKIIFYIALVGIVFIVLAWDSDIKPRIFSKPDAVKVKPTVKLGILIYSVCFYVALLVFAVLQSIVADSEIYRIVTGCIVACLAIIFGHHFTKRSLRRIFFDTSISLHMNPEEYAKTLSPHYVVQYIETHLSDKEALERYIKTHKRLGHISDPCAWAFLVAYCNKNPRSL